jgi:hypothetical protein
LKSIQVRALAKFLVCDIYLLFIIQTSLLCLLAGQKMSDIHRFDVSHAALVPLPSTPLSPKLPQAEVIQPRSTAEPNALWEGDDRANGRDTNDNAAKSNETVNNEEQPQYEDPLSLSQHKKADVSRKQLKVDHPKADKKKLKKFYTRQNDLIDTFLASGDEERLGILDMQANGLKIKIAVYGSSAVNFCLFVIQMYAAISTGSLSLFATAADAFVSKEMSDYV